MCHFQYESHIEFFIATSNLIENDNSNVSYRFIFHTIVHSFFFVQYKKTYQKFKHFVAVN